MKNPDSSREALRSSTRSPTRRGRNKLPSTIPLDAFIQAIANLETGASHAFADSTKYDVLHQGKRYPPKAVVGIAAQSITGKRYVPSDFSGGVGSKCFRLLTSAGLHIVPKIGEIEDENEAEAESEEILFEGDAKVRTVRQYERSRKARQECLTKNGTSCSACGFEFEKRYGQIGKGFIHVHHLEMVAARKGPYNVDPHTDLVPVCANCHAMLHRRRPPYTIEELRSMMRTLSPDNG